MDDRTKRILLNYLMLYGWRDAYETEEEFLKVREEVREHDG